MTHLKIKKVTIYDYNKMFQATDSFLQLRANAEDTWQMIPVLEENHRFNMHSKWYCQYHQHDMQKKKNCCICIPCGYRTTYERLNFVFWVSHGVLDAEIEPALVLFSREALFHLCGYGLQKIPCQFTNWYTYYITVCVWCHMTAKSIIRLIYLWDHKFTLLHHIYCDTIFCHNPI